MGEETVECLFYSAEEVKSDAGAGKNKEDKVACIYRRRVQNGAVQLPKGGYYQAERQAEDHRHLYQRRLYVRRPHENHIQR